MRFPPRSDPQREHPFNSEFSMQEGTSPYGTEVFNLRTNLHRVERRFVTSAQHCKVTRRFGAGWKPPFHAPAIPKYATTMH